MADSNPYETPTAETTNRVIRKSDFSIVRYGFLGATSIGILGAVWISIRTTNTVRATLLTGSFVLCVCWVWFGLLAWLSKASSNQMKLFAAGLAGALAGLSISLSGVFLGFPRGLPRYALVAMTISYSIIIGLMGMGALFTALVRYSRIQFDRFLQDALLPKTNQRFDNE